MKEFIKKYVELEVLAMSYLYELIDAQKSAPEHFHNNIVDWCNGITVDHLEADSEGVYANYRIDEWDCSGSWFLDITSRNGINGKLEELKSRVDNYLLQVKISKEEHENKELKDHQRLCRKFK